MPNGFTIPIPFLGEFKIYYYAIIIMAGAVAAAYLAAIEARRRGISAEYVWDALIWVLLGGIIGARIWHIFTPPPSMVELGITTQYYLTHPLDAINIRNGGLGIPGAVIGGAIALYFYCRRKGLDFLTWTDIAAPALALGQAIGRWGNYFNQEVYGQPTTLPWGIKHNQFHWLSSGNSLSSSLFIQIDIQLCQCYLFALVCTAFQRSLAPGRCLLNVLDYVSNRALPVGFPAFRRRAGGGNQHKPDDHVSYRIMLIFDHLFSPSKKVNPGGEHHQCRSR